jgi:hypothetical protein
MLKTRGLACLTMLLGAGLLLSFSSLAQAAGEYEPNDTREAAYGPLAGGVDYTATFETNNDNDWYIFYVKTYSQMDFSGTMLKQSCNDANRDVYAAPRLLDKDGHVIDGFAAGSENTTTHLLLTLNPGRYYLEVENDSCTGDRYRFRIDPAASITTSRECGEAIVAKDTVAPQLATANTELAKKNKVLAKRATVLEEAKAAMRKAAKKVRRLSKRPNAPRWRKRQARREKLEAREDLTKAQKDYNATTLAMTRLQGIVTQHQQAIASAEGQMATYC